MTAPGRIALLPLRNRAGQVIAHAIISAADHPALSAWRWSLNTNGYVWRSVDGARRHIYLHRQLLGCVPGDGLHVDHINRDKLDNRRENLRVVTPAEGRQNTPAIGGTSRYRGVQYDKDRHMWTAIVHLARKSHRVGRYATEEEANAAAIAWRRTHMPFSVEDDLPPPQGDQPAHSRYRKSAA